MVIDGLCHSTMETVQNFRLCSVGGLLCRNGATELTNLMYRL